MQQARTPPGRLHIAAVPAPERYLKVLSLVTEPRLPVLTSLDATNSFSYTAWSPVTCNNRPGSVAAVKPGCRTLLGLQKPVGCPLNSQSRLRLLQVYLELAVLPGDSSSSYLKSSATGRKWELVHNKGTVLHYRGAASTWPTGQMHRVQDNRWQSHIPRDSNGKLAIWCAVSCHWRKTVSFEFREKQPYTLQQRQEQQVLQVLLPLIPRAHTEHNNVQLQPAL